MNQKEIDLRDLWDAIWKGKWWISAFTLVAAVSSVIFALSLPNYYRAEVVLAPSEEAQGGGLGQMAGQLGGIASLAGFDLGGGQIDKATVALEILSSRSFIGDFIERHDIKVPLIATKAWQESTNTLLVDPELYNQDRGQWVRDVNPPKASEPSLWEATKVFREDVLRVNRDQQSGIVVVSVEHLSPYIAREWATLLVEDLNNYMRDRDVHEAERSIAYLDEQMQGTRLASMQQVFSQLIEKQTQTMMLANVRDEYMFRIIDPAVAPEDRSRPSRALIAIAGTFLGGLLGTLVALIRYFWRT